MDALPDSVVAHILHSLQAGDLSRCMCINRQWRALIPTLAVWSPIARERWKYWDDKWQPLQAAGQWKQIFNQRLQVRNAGLLPGAETTRQAAKTHMRCYVSRRTFRQKRFCHARSGRWSGTDAWQTCARWVRTHWCAVAWSQHDCSVACLGVWVIHERPCIAWLQLHDTSHRRKHCASPSGDSGIRPLCTVSRPCRRSCNRRA